MNHNRSGRKRRLIFGMAIPPQDRTAHYGEPQLVSQEEVVHRLGISRTTVWRLIKNADLEAVHIGSRTLISNRSINDYLARQSSATRPE